VASYFACAINKQMCNFGRFATLLRRFCFETLPESTFTSALINALVLTNVEPEISMSAKACDHYSRLLPVCPLGKDRNFPLVDLTGLIEFGLWAIPLRTLR
jgi:hypothetical protein